MIQVHFLTSSYNTNLHKQGGWLDLRGQPPWSEYVTGWYHIFPICSPYLILLRTMSEPTKILDQQNQLLPCVYQRFQVTNSPMSYVALNSQWLKIGGIIVTVNSAI